MSHVTFCLSHVTCYMWNACVDPWDMLNNFCFHVYAQKWVFVIMSHVTCHISHVRCHMSHCACHMSYDTLQNQTIKMVPTCPLNSSSHNLHMNIIILRAPFSPMAYGHFDILQYMVSIDKIGYICIRNSKMTHFWLKMRPTKSTVIKRHDLRGVVLFFLVHFWDEYLTSLIHSFRKCIALFCR